MHNDSELHFSGQSTFVDDWPLPETTLYAAVFVSPIANGLLKSIDARKARAMPGIKAVLTAADIAGENQIGEIMPDEELLATKNLKFIGKPIALVLADSPATAEQGAEAIEIAYDELATEFNVRNAYHNNMTFGDERQFTKGDTKSAFEQAKWVVSGQVNCAAQEHLYFETQISIAIPVDKDRLKIISASQNPSAIQKLAAKVLGLSMNSIEVEVPRLGGAFGGKEEQAKPWACLAALGAHLTGRPVKLALSRQQDMHWTGKRHPYSADYRIAADETGRIQAYDVKFLQDGGAVADLSTAVLERTLFHATNAYQIPNANVKAVSCRTHHPSNTAFRGFGAPQAIFTIEAAIDHLAWAMNLPRWKIQQKNLLQPGYRFDYGMAVQTDALQNCWQQLFKHKKIEMRLADIQKYNANKPRYIRSLALTPLCFGISFTATHLNQASVTVTIYTDASIGVAIGAVEMGQGVVDKIAIIVARSLGVSVKRVRVDFTNSSKSPNMSPTAASVGADLNGMAAIKACEKLKLRLVDFSNTFYGVDLSPETNFENNAITWEDLIANAYLQRINLSEHAFYATPDLYFDRVKEQGIPFSYHVYGVSAIESTLDTLLGTYHIDKVDVVYDLGQSLDTIIDLGQMEGGLVQGIGYATMEEIRWDKKGKLLTDSFATYKIPDLLSSPQISVDFIDSPSNPHGPFSAKAIGEPPLLLGLGAFFSISDSIRLFNKTAPINYTLPLTPERALLALYS